MNIIVGTAGHIDHGKTTLIKALTGTDTDRLPEEKKRGITIDIGFAELSLGEHRIGFVDVPGHERFVKNMLAGASGIDLVLLVIAADEGVMSQTREHFDICRMLDVPAGLVVLTKRDLVDDDLLGLVRLEAAELVEDSFLANAPVVAVSASSGEGLAELRSELLEACARVRSRRDDQVTRLPIDRSFTVKGFGAVVTGTLASGDIREGDELELMPVRRRVRVRGLQSHGKRADIAKAGQRVALNLAGIDHSEVARGMTLCEPGALEPVQIFDAEIDVLKNAPRPLRSRQRVRVHIGTSEILARVHVINSAGEIAPGGRGFVQFRLETPVTAMMGERFIVRSYSPQVTIAGGRVIDPLPVKHRPRDTADVVRSLEQLGAAGDDHESVIRHLVEMAGTSGVDPKHLQARTGWRTSVIGDALARNQTAGAAKQAETFWLATRSFDELKRNAVETVEAHHNADPLSPGISRDILRDRAFRRVPPDVFRTVLNELEREGRLTAQQDLVKLASHARRLSPTESEFLEHVEKQLLSAGLAPPKIGEMVATASAGIKIGPADVVKLLASSPNVIKVSDEFYFDRTAIEALAEKLRGCAASLPNRLIDVPAFKDLAGVSRKYAIPLLEYFDRVGITKRAGDKRIITR